MSSNQHVDQKEHLFAIVREIGTGMLTTKNEDGSLRGRPMGVAEVNDIGELIFPTTITDGKVKGIARDPSAAVLFQSAAKWVNLTGTLRVTTDRALIDRLWNDSWKLFFPKGKDDPELSLLIFDPSEGEYWDNTGKRGVRFVFEAAKAFLTGTQPDAKKTDENARMKL
jgi:general stress protein 26